MDESAYKVLCSVAEIVRGGMQFANQEELLPLLIFLLFVISPAALYDDSNLLLLFLLSLYPTDAFCVTCFFAALTANVAMSKSPVRAESRLAAAPVCLTYLESMNLFDLNTLGIVPYNRVI